MDCENCRHLTVVGFHDTGPMSQKCANYVQHIGLSSRATCLPHSTKGQINNFDRVEIAFIISLSYWQKVLTDEGIIKLLVFNAQLNDTVISRRSMKERRKPEYPQKTPDDELQLLGHR